MLENSVYPKGYRYPICYPHQQFLQSLRHDDLTFSDHLHITHINWGENRRQMGAYYSIIQEVRFIFLISLFSVFSFEASMTSSSFVNLSTKDRSSHHEQEWLNYKKCTYCCRTNEIMQEKALLEKRLFNQKFRELNWEYSTSWQIRRKPIKEWIAMQCIKKHLKCND